MEVDIKVKSPYSDKFNKQDTMAFLNELCCYLGEARNMYKLMGLNGLEKSADKTYTDIWCIYSNCIKVQKSLKIH